MLEGFQREYDEIEEQIAELRRQQAVLRLTMDHFAAYKENLLGVKELEVPDDRWDIFFDEEQPDPALDDWLEHFGLFTQGLHIPAAILEQEPLPEKVPVRLTVGTYVPILRENKVAIPRKAILIPKGRYLSAKVVLDGERALDREQLLPLITYAREHGYRMVGDTTAFIFRLSRENDHIRFFYRLRVRVE